jgi:hypothetical protein
MKKFLPPQIFIAAAIAGLFVGCSPGAVKAKGSRDEGQTAIGSAWNWEQYPIMSRMRVAVLPCQLQPKSTITVVSPISGLLRVYVNAPQKDLAANTLWAEFEPESFAQEEQAMAEALKRIEDQERVQLDLEYPRKKMDLEQQIEDAEKEVQKLQLLSTNDALAKRLYGVGPVGTNKNLMRPEMLEKLEANLHLLKQRLVFLKSTNHAALGFDLAGQRTDWKRRELEFKRRRQQSRFEMPFDGKLTLNIPISAGVTNYPVNLGQELAVARDISSVRVRVAMENSAWTGLSPEKLRAMVTSAGEMLEARFAFQKIERIQNREESAYYFEFPPERAAAAARFIGAAVQAQLWTDLPEPARVVPKLAVVLHKPDAFQNKDWSSAVATTFPGARLLVEGQTDLAIVAPKQIQLSSAK